MPAKPLEEIQSEISQLRAVKPMVPKMTFFNENNHAAIEAAIETLEENLFSSQIHERFEPTGDDIIDSEENRQDHVLENALNAKSWAEGHEEDPPSKDWKEVAGIKELPTTEAEKLVKLPVAKWAGQCYAIAAGLLKKGFPPAKNAKLKYGHWLGPIHPKSMFHGSTICQHGWIEVTKDSETLIIDPTRWVFENRAPYIYEGPNDFYDDGGQELQAKRLGNSPEPEGELEFFPPQHPEVCTILTRENLDPQKPLAKNQVFHLANLPPKFFPKEGIKELYAWIESLGMASFIPIDFQRIANE